MSANSPKPTQRYASDGTDWNSQLMQMMQTIMRNNPTARCYDGMGKLIRPLENYHPHLRGWWRSFSE